jgi:hypothetical protein
VFMPPGRAHARTRKLRNEDEQKLADGEQWEGGALFRGV